MSQGTPDSEHRTRKHPEKSISAEETLNTQTLEATAAIVEDLEDLKPTDKPVSGRDFEGRYGRQGPQISRPIWPRRQPVGQAGNASNAV